MNQIYELLKGKTFKREVAGAMLIAIFVAFFWIILDDDPTLIEARLAVLAIMVGPVFLFAAAAWGMDSFNRQYVPMKAASDRMRDAPIQDEELAALIPPQGHGGPS